MKGFLYGLIEEQNKSNYEENGKFKVDQRVYKQISKFHALLVEKYCNLVLVMCLLYIDLITCRLNIKYKSLTHVVLL